MTEGKSVTLTQFQYFWILLLFELPLPPQTHSWVKKMSKMKKLQKRERDDDDGDDDVEGRECQWPVEVEFLVVPEGTLNRNKQHFMYLIVSHVPHYLL